MESFTMPEGQHANAYSIFGNWHSRNPIGAGRIQREAWKRRDRADTLNDKIYEEVKGRHERFLSGEENEESHHCDTAAVALGEVTMESRL